MLQELVDEASGLVATHSYRPASFLVVFRIIRRCLPSGLDIRFILLSISNGFLSGKVLQHILCTSQCKSIFFINSRSFPFYPTTLIKSCICSNVWLVSQREILLCCGMVRHVSTFHPDYLWQWVPCRKTAEGDWVSLQKDVVL